MYIRLSSHFPIVLAFLACISLSEAAPYDRAHFETTLRQKLADKEGPAAYTAAGTVLKSALGKKAYRKQAPFYLSRILSDLRSRLAEPSQTRARTYLASVFVREYFKGALANPDDPIFIAGARTLIFRKMPILQQTSAHFIAISRPFYRYFHRPFSPNDGWIFQPSDFPDF